MPDKKVELICERCGKPFRFFAFDRDYEKKGVRIRVSCHGVVAVFTIPDPEIIENRRTADTFIEGRCNNELQISEMEKMFHG